MVSTLSRGYPDGGESVYTPGVMPMDSGVFVEDLLFEVLEFAGELCCLHE
jgi:hypothetical protein